MWLLLTAPALAGAGPVLEVYLNSQAVTPPLQAEVGGEQIVLRDDGVAPDRSAGDSYWSGEFSQPGSVGYQQGLTITDGAGGRWQGGMEWSGAAPHAATVGLESGGTVIKPPFPAPRTVPSLRESAATGDGGSGGGGGSAQPAWLLAALGWGLFIAAALRQVRLRPRAVPGQPPPLSPGHRAVQADAAARARLLAWMAQHHRVILLGEVQAAVPAGAVFTPRSADLGDVSALVEALDGLGRPLAVLIGEDVRGADALAEGLAADLPVLVARAGSAPGQWSVAGDGSLVAPA